MIPGIVATLWRRKPKVYSGMVPYEGNFEESLPNALMTPTDGFSDDYGLYITSQIFECSTPDLRTTLPSGDIIATFTDTDFTG